MTENNEFEGLGQNTSSSTENKLELVTTGSSNDTTSSPSEHNEDTDLVKDAQSDEYREPTPESEITVHVSNKTAPIVLFFGAPSSGKTMTLVRLAKYLRSKSYKVTVDSNFCRSAWEYKENMENYNKMLGTQYALKGTDRNDFLFFQIKDAKGNVICQLLEGAGENYFPSDSPKGVDRASLAFPRYMAEVFSTPNKKVWAFITEPNWEVKQNDKEEYVRRIQYCKSQFSGKKDKFIVLYNKVDRSDTMIDKDSINAKAAMKGCSDEYPGIFNTFEKESFLWGKSIKCEFVPFSTGHFDEFSPNYTPSADSHPARLWKAILKSING